MSAEAIQVCVILTFVIIMVLLIWIVIWQRQQIHDLRDKINKNSMMAGILSEMDKKLEKLNRGGQ